MKRSLFVLFLIIMSPLLSICQTYISGGIYSDTTWKPNGNPYIITGNTVVFDAATLTIKPGVIIKFDSAVGLEVRGRLIALGNKTDSIVFTSNLSNPSLFCWKGITVVGTTSPLGAGSQVTMDYCKGEYAYTFIDLNIAYHGPYLFTHCRFDNNYYVNNDGGMPLTVFDRCKFDNNNTGLSTSQFDARVSNSYFINNINGINQFPNVDTCYFFGNTGIALQPYGNTIGCTIQYNNIGVSSSFNNINKTFINNYITDNNVGVEIQTYFNGSEDFYGNTICNNTSYNAKLLQNFDANIPNNCWCTTDSITIRSKIYDGYVNVASGLLNFLPANTNCQQIVMGINDNKTIENVKIDIYPNPFGESITILKENNQKNTFMLYDLTSRLLVKTDFLEKTNINTWNIDKGIYFYQILEGNIVLKTGKLIKNE